MDDTKSTTDRDKIIDALHRWAYAIYGSDEQVLRSILAEDIFVDASSYRNRGLDIPDVRGKDEVIQRLLGLRRQCGTMHFLSNFQANVNKSIGHVTCYVYAQHFRQGLGIHFGLIDVFTMAHTYDVVLTPNLRDWQIKELKMIAMWTTGNPGVCGFADVHQTVSE